MTPRRQQVAEKPRRGRLEKALLCIVLGLMVLRLTIIETPLIEQTQGQWISSENISLLLSTCVLLCAGVWFLAAVVSGRFCWRKTWFGVWIGVFAAAGIVAAVCASNKRAAVSDLVILAAPMIAGLMLVQWLRSAALIRLALLLILAVGAAATVQCVDQKFESNEQVVAQYEANPAEHLQNMGIEPNSMEHWMYEHRIYSSDIRGFSMTSNSAATFFLLAIFAAAGLCLQTVRKKMTQQQLALLVCFLLAGGIVLAGLFLTQSKGGIGAFCIVAALLVLLPGFGKGLWKRRRVFGILLLLLIVLAAGAVIHYGISHGRLPGGNSMLVRWQYWVAAAAMIRDHVLTGVGGGNFPEYYTQYKIPAALETVQNPHNWIVSLLSQYGPLGLLSIAAAMLLVFFKGLQNTFASQENPNLPSPQSPSRFWIGLLTFAALMLLIVRPVLVDMEFFYQKPEVAAAAYLFLYLVPAAVFVLAFMLLRAASGNAADEQSRGLSIALLCGLVAVLIHNLVDFAIFEPGNWSVFWLFAAILIAHIHNVGNHPEKEIVLDPPKRMGLFSGLVIVGIAYVAIVLLPPLRAEALFKQAMHANRQRDILFAAAIDADPLSAKAASQAATILTRIHQNWNMKDAALLDPAAGFANIAIDRNPADFKLWRLRAKINVIRSEQTQGAAKEAALQKALTDLQEAVALYPGSDKLHFLLASVAEQLKLNDAALYHYQTAIDIEDAYREQFKIMYPNRDTVISRLGDTTYAEAKAKIQALQKNTP